MVRILVIGANGGVGQHLIRALEAHEDTFTAGVRKDAQVEAYRDSGVDALQIDVAQDDIETLAEKIQGYDTVVFSVGAGGKSTAEQTIYVDLDGAVKTIEASIQANVRHFVMVSTYDSRRCAFDTIPELKLYTIAKHYADIHLRQSELPYTIVHPGALTDNPKTENVTVAHQFDDNQSGEITREDVALVLHRVIHEFDGQNREFQVLQGDEPIAETVANYFHG